MIVDTSALIAILRDEPDSEVFINTLSRSTPRMSAATYLETAVVVDANRDPVLSRRLDDLLTAARIEILPATAAQAEIARRAYRDFGRASGHAAALNFGDCFAYALARERDEPLLFKGDDFVHTDIASAL